MRTLGLVVVMGATGWAFVACGDDSGTTGSSGSGGASSSTSTSSSSTSTTSGPTSGPASSSSDTSGPTSTSTGDGGDVTQGTSQAVGPGGSGGAGSTGTEATGGGTGTGGAPACSDLPAGPFEPVLFTDVLDGSEDIALDGLGNLAGKNGTDMVLVDADGVTTEILAQDIPSAFGTRFDGDGNLIVALPNQGRVVSISPGGAVEDLAEGLSGPNGIHVSSDGRIWVTELPAGRIQTIVPGEPPVQFIGDGVAATVNGVFVDEARGIVFFTNYSAGQVRRVDLDQPGDPVLVASVDGALFDGLTMDACGNVYAVDQGNARVYRIFTDAAGDAIGDPELVAALPTGVANAQFGRGPGFSPTTLYMAGTPGSVYAIDLGVEGAPQVGP